MTDALPAGPELDSLIAEKVMGWAELSILNENVVGQRFYMDEEALGFPPEMANSERKTIGGYAYWTLNRAKPVPKFSSDIAEAWKVVEALGNLYLELGRVSTRIKSCPDHAAGHLIYEVSFKDGQGFAPTAPHAICIAALMAVEVKAGLR